MHSATNVLLWPEMAIFDVLMLAFIESPPRYLSPIALSIGAFLLAATKGATKFRMEARQLAQDNSISQPYKLCKIRDRRGDLTKRWYVEFYVWSDYENKMVRRVDYSMNHLKTVAERMAEAKRIKLEIDTALAKGLYIKVEEKKPKPKPAKKIPAAKESTSAITGESTFRNAIEFVVKVKTASLSDRSGTTYKSIANIFQNWLQLQEYDIIKLKEINETIIYEFLDYLKLEREVDNITHNNYLIYCKVIFNFYKNRKVLTDSPCANIKELPEQEKSHVAYTDPEKARIKEYLTQKDPQLLLFCTFMYYTFVRRNELRLTQIKNLREKFFIPASIELYGKKERVSKNGKSESVIIPNGLEEIIQNLKLREYPPEYFLFGENGLPGPKPYSISYFSNKHRAVVLALELTSGHDLYSWKHTGVVKLYQQIKDIKRVKEQCRHSDIRDTEKYLRSLGLFDNEEVQNKFPVF